MERAEELEKIKEQQRETREGLAALRQRFEDQVGRMREAGIPTMIWLDDGLNLWPSVAEGERRLPEVDEALEHFLGPGARHPDKGEGWPKPVEVLEKHLGYRVDLKSICKY